MNLSERSRGKAKGRKRKPARRHQGGSKSLDSAWIGLDTLQLRILFDGALPGSIQLQSDSLANGDAQVVDRHLFYKTHLATPISHSTNRRCFQGAPGYSPITRAIAEASTP